jgi:hypothetical protein
MPGHALNTITKIVVDIAWHHTATASSNSMDNLAPFSAYIAKAAMMHLGTNALDADRKVLMKMYKNFRRRWGSQN